jgi:hypothetical protein
VGNDRAGGQLYVRDRLEGNCNPAKIAQDKWRQNRGWHVPRRNLQQAQWRPMNNVGRHKVALLADDDAPFRFSQAVDVRVAAAVLVWQIQRVHGLVPCGRQGNRKL